MVEEYCNHDLAEYYVTTHSEELHCVVSPDFLRKHIVDDIPNDPYCTPGFITAFRMLSPLYEPVFGAPARTMSGALSEMERLIGDALYSGYVGYNGRAPGVPARKDEATKETQERRREGGDARHILVAYFEIKELASILGVDWQTSNLSVRIFRFTASNTSLRNRSVESLATAAFVAAVQRRCRDHEEALRAKDPAAKDIEEPPWLPKLKKLTVRDIAQAANLDESEVHRNLKVVNVALRKQRPDSYESIVAQMPVVCNQLNLEERTRKLAIDIASRAISLNICARRAPASVSAACIYMACHLDGVRKTQTEVCRATTVTEVTLRKVHKELQKEEQSVVPGWFVTHKETIANSDGKSKTGNKQNAPPAPPVPLPNTNVEASRPRSLIPPALPPGFTNPSAQSAPPVPYVFPNPPQPSVVPAPVSPSINTQHQIAPGSTTTPIQHHAPQTGIVPGIAPPPSIPPPLPTPQGTTATPVVPGVLPNQNPEAMQAVVNALVSNPAALQTFLSMMTSATPPAPPPLPPRLPERVAPNGTTSVPTEMANGGIATAAPNSNKISVASTGANQTVQKTGDADKE